LVRDLDYSRTPARFISEQWIWVERKGARSFNFLTPQKKRVVCCCHETNLYTAVQDQLAEKVEFVWVDNIKELCEEVTHSPAHLVIINEPDHEGLLNLMIEAAAKIKDTPIIGSSFSSPLGKITRAGAFEYIQKPFSNQHLREVVARVEPYPKRIMIVDDNIEVQRLVARLLRQQNDTTEFLLADTGLHACNLMKRKMPDLILLDLALPDIDGWQLLMQLKNNPELCHIPVIIVSARDLDDSPPHTKIAMFVEGEGITTDKFVGMISENLNLQ
jgi:CheY-like chemotaxis protein